MSPHPDHTLHAIVVNLMAAEDGFIPLTQGPLAQAAFLDLLRAADPDLAAHLHDDNQRKPYTISPLHNLPRADERGRHALKAGQRAWLRITLLDPVLFTAFFQRLFAEGASLRLRIGGAQFLIESVLGAPGSHPWGGYTTTAALAEEAGSERRVRMQFFSPTAMNRGQEGAARKRMVLLPEPRMVFGSLRGAWNKLVGDDLPFEFERWAEEYVFVREVRSWQTGVYQLKGNVHIGGYGDVTFEALDAEPDWLRILNLLADFAFYSGVGAKTAMGMGQARRVG